MMRKLKLDQRGFTWHLALPVLAVIGVAAIGGYLVSHGHAATPTSYATVTVTSNAKECVDNKYNKKATYNVVQIYTCNSTQAQKWAVNASSTAGEIINGNGYCLNVYKTGTTVGTPVDIYPCKNSTAQQWTVISSTGAIKNPNSKLCLAYATPLVSTGTPLKLAACNTSAATDQWTVHTSSGGSSSSGGSGSTSASHPYASALSSYTTVAQSYTASQMISGNWASDSNESQEGGHSCATADTTYDSANDAVKLATNGTSSCGAIRSEYTAPTKNSVLESDILMPGSSATHMLDWGSYWTDGAVKANTSNSTGSTNENWPTTGEVDAVETQYGQSYVSIHCACLSDYSPNTNSSTVWTTEPKGWEDPETTYGSTSGANIGPVWTVVDIAFNADGSIGIYYNGALYTTVPASAAKWNTGYTYVDWGIGAPGSSSSSWPGGSAFEEVKYFKVFTK